MKRVSVFGATGSIGQNTLDLIARDRHAYDVVALTGGGNIEQLAKDAKALQAEVAVTAYPEKLDELRDALAGSGVEAAAGPEAIAEAADRPADWIMSAIVGAAGLVPGLRALRHGTTLALANKESLVTAGPHLMAEAKRHGARILPVDSEHSAVFQGLVGENIEDVERIVITASGGALRDWPLEQLGAATLADACAHPNWDMGQRITIDSASMFNKALELIETREFFDVSPEQIEAVVHPQSLIHALVGFRDGALMAHIGPPDMRHAIGYALHWPDRKHLPVARLDLAQIATLEFRPACEKRWPALRLAREVMHLRGLAGACFNAAKESALDAFIAGQIGFLTMTEVVERTLEQTQAREGLDSATVSLDNILSVDHLSRTRAVEIAAQLAGAHTD